MNPLSIEDSLAAAESALDAGLTLRGTGFWPAVSVVKGQEELIDRYADRIAAIDSAAFRNWALLRIPIRAGTILATAAALIGIAAIGFSYSLAEVQALISFFAGVAILLVATHGLGHLVVGRALGIRFTYWFVGSWRRPQPGVKVEYSSYLQADPAARAWMHAAGALTTKLVPVSLIGAAIAADLPGWVAWSLVLLAVGTTVTDVLWSTRSSDWKRYRREMSYAKGYSA